MKVITWNVNNRYGTVPQQAQALGEREPHVVALQDVNRNAVARYLEEFRFIGLPHILHTLERQPQAIPTGVLLASSFPLSLLPDLPEHALWSGGASRPTAKSCGSIGAGARSSPYCTVHGAKSSWPTSISPRLITTKRMRKVCASGIPPSSWICWPGSITPSLSQRAAPGCSAATSTRRSTSEKAVRLSPRAISNGTGTISSNTLASMNSNCASYEG